MQLGDGLGTRLLPMHVRSKLIVRKPASFSTRARPLVEKEAGLRDYIDYSAVEIAKLPCPS